MGLVGHSAGAAQGCPLSFRRGSDSAWLVRVLPARRSAGALTPKNNAFTTCKRAEGLDGRGKGPRDLARSRALHTSGPVGGQRATEMRPRSAQPTDRGFPLSPFAHRRRKSGGSAQRPVGPRRAHARCRALRRPTGRCTVQGLLHPPTGRCTMRELFSHRRRRVKERSPNPSAARGAGADLSRATGQRGPKSAALGSGRDLGCLFRDRQALRPVCKW